MCRSGTLSAIAIQYVMYQTRNLKRLTEGWGTVLSRQQIMVVDYLVEKVSLDTVRLYCSDNLLQRRAINL